MKIGVIVGLVLIASGVNAAFGQFPQSRRIRDRLDGSIKASDERERIEEAEKAAVLPEPKKAVMNVDVQIVLSKGEFKTFAEAKAAEARKVLDGEPLWAYVKFRGKLGDYVLTTRNPEDSEKLRYTLFAEVAPRDDVTALHQYSIQFAKEDLLATEIKIGLAPAAFGRNKSIPVFLMTSSGARNGVWNNEFRLTNTVAMPRGLTDNLASVPVTLDFSAGIAKYRKLYSEYDSVILRGTTDVSKLPAPGTFFREDFRTRIAAKLAEEKIEPLKIYFSGDDWQESASFGMNTRKSRKIFATFTYRRGDVCFYGVAEVVENYDIVAAKYGEAEIKLQKDLSIPCAEVN